MHDRDIFFLFWQFRISVCWMKSLSNLQDFTLINLIFFSQQLNILYVEALSFPFDDKDEKKVDIGGFSFYLFWCALSPFHRWR